MDTDILAHETNVTSHHIEGCAREGNTPFSCPLISQVTDDGQLWQGGCEDGISLGGMFKHVVSLYPWESYSAFPLDSFTQVRLYDGPTVPDEWQLYHLAHWINFCRAHGRTLVHCQAGLNRSALLIGLALVVAGGEPQAVIDQLRAKRDNAVLCNPAFRRWLLQQQPGQQRPTTST